MRTYSKIILLAISVALAMISCVKIQTKVFLDENIPATVGQNPLAVLPQEVETVGTLRVIGFGQQDCILIQEWTR